MVLAIPHFKKPPFEKSSQPFHGATPSELSAQPMLDPLAGAILSLGAGEHCMEFGGGPLGVALWYEGGTENSSDFGRFESQHNDQQDQWSTKLLFSWALGIMIFGSVLKQWNRMGSAVP